MERGAGTEMEKFQDYAYYYNAFYQDKDYKKEAGTVENLFKRWGTGKQNAVLNLGCGTGRHDVELAKMGYSVTGIDLSSRMIEIAKNYSGAMGTDVEYEAADIRNYTAVKTYDVVTSLFHVMSYQTSNEDILGAFYTAGKALRDGGIFVFDLWYGPGVLSDKPAVKIKTAEDEEHLLYRIAVPKMYAEENTVDVNYRVFVTEKKSKNVSVIDEVHKMRYFFVPELKAYLYQAGFELLECLDGNTLQKTDFNSWTAICIAKKTGGAHD